MHSIVKLTRSARWMAPAAAAGLVLAASAAAPAHAQAAAAATYQLTLENLADGQPFSPPVFATHDPAVHVFEPGQPASAGVAAVAESGNDSPLAHALQGLDAVTDVVQVGRPLTPHGSAAGGFTDTATVTLEAGSDDVLSFVGMLICTNDGFGGLDNVDLPDQGSITYDVNSYDAGVEDNTEVSEDLVDPCSALGPMALPGDPDGNRTTEVASDPPVSIGRHPGVAGDGELVAEHDWTDPVARLTVERLPAQYVVWLSNTTAGQPFSPPVFATHRDDVAVFQSGEPASRGVAEVAQAGDPSRLVGALEAAQEVTDIVSLGRPLPPGSAIAGYAPTALASLEADPGDVMSFVGMLICTNDGFAGMNSLELPATGPTSFGVNDYDAGVENNTEVSRDLVDPCSGLGPITLDGDPNGNDDTGPATDPVAPVTRHANIDGDGDLTVADHGWDVPVGQLVVAQVRDAFADDDGSVHEEAVNLLAALEVIRGTADGDMDAAGAVTRGMLASMLDGALDLPETDQDAFADDDGSVHEHAINRLAAAELLAGFRDGTVRAARPVTRAQLASILHRALRAPAADQDAFGDDDGNVHEEAIDAIAALEIVEGFADGSFGPATTVSRGQAASIIVRALGPRG